jgi:hypothetical protein
MAAKSKREAQVQVHGAANEALSGAAAAVKAELAAKALAPGRAAAALVPSPALPLSLVAAARWLLAAARLSVERSKRLQKRLLAAYELTPFQARLRLTIRCHPSARLC